MVLPVANHVLDILRHTTASCPGKNDPTATSGGTFPTSGLGRKLLGGFRAMKKKKRSLYGGWRFKKRPENRNSRVEKIPHLFGSLAGSAAERPPQPVANGRFRRQRRCSVTTVPAYFEPYLKSASVSTSRHSFARCRCTSISQLGGDGG